MAAKTFEGMIRDIREKRVFPVYFLMGEETFYIDVISDFLEEHLLGEAEREFDLTVLYGKDTDVNGIVGSAKRYPMVGTQHLVIVKEAQQLKQIEDFLDNITVDYTQEHCQKVNRTQLN